MSVLRELVQRHMAVTPSMECANIEQRLDVLYDHFSQLMTALPQAAAGDVSMESASFLSSIGYSTEAEEKKGLLARIWEAIKNTFNKIKEFIGRLLEIRKHHLKNNELKLDKLKKYIHAIDMSAKPSGEMKPSTSLLSREPGKVVAEVEKYRTQAKKVMEFRGHALDTLQKIDLKTLASKDALDYIEPLFGQESSVGDDNGSVAFKNNHSEVSYKFHFARGPRGSDKPVQAASVVLMGTLIKEYEKILEDDATFIKDYEARKGAADKFLKEMEAQKEANGVRGNIDVGSDKSIDEQIALSNRIWKQTSVLVGHFNKITRLNHSGVWDILTGDIEELLQKSLGQYKFKKAEVAEEDRGKSSREDDDLNRQRKEAKNGN